MPKTKMKKTKYALGFLLIATLVATAIHRGIASGQQQDPHQHHHSQTQKDGQNTRPPLIDGAVNPQAIPDLVAYEFLLGSVAEGANATELDRKRAKSFADKTGLNEQKSRALTTTANSVKERLSSLDAQARELKDRNWPNPSPAVMAQLGQLQAQKEAMLREQIASLIGQLDASEKEKLSKRLFEIKQKVKMYQPLSVEHFQRR